MIYEGDKKSPSFCFGVVSTKRDPTILISCFVRTLKRPDNNLAPERANNKSFIKTL